MNKQSNKQSILIVAGLVGAIGVTSVASAMEFNVYGSIRAGVHIPTSDDAMTSDHDTVKFGVAEAQGVVDTEEDTLQTEEDTLLNARIDLPTARQDVDTRTTALATRRASDDEFAYTPTGGAAMTMTVAEWVQAETDAQNAISGTATTAQQATLDAATAAVVAAVKVQQDALDAAQADLDATEVDIAAAPALIVAAQADLDAATERHEWAVTVAGDDSIVNPTPELSGGDEESTTGWNWGFGDAFDRVGIKGSEDFGNGMSAGFRFERGTDRSGELGVRHENVWIKGGWGQLTLGQQDNPFRSVANWDQSYFLGGYGHQSDGGSRPNGIRYDGGSGPFSFSVMGTARAEDEGQAGYTTRVNAENGDFIDRLNHIELTHPEVERVDGIDSLIVAAHYKIGSAATINLGLRSNNVESNVLGDQYSNTSISANGSAGSFTWYVGYAINADNYKEPTVDYTPQDGAADANGTAGADYVSTRYVAQDSTTLGLFVQFNAIYLEYESVTNDGADEALGDLGLTNLVLGYSHSIGPNASFNVEYGSVDQKSELSGDSSTIVAVVKVGF